jgi:hypothetical protein
MGNNNPGLNRKGDLNEISCDFETAISVGSQRDRTEITVNITA